MALKQPHKECIVRLWGYLFRCSLRGRKKIPTYVYISLTPLVDINDFDQKQKTFKVEIRILKFN